jgi:hypothetical protein
VPPDWAELLAASPAPDTVTAHTYLKSWPSASSPVLLRCHDGRDYVVKGAQSGRQAVNDQIVARLSATKALAPTGRPALVDVPAALVQAQPEMAHVTAGLAHGTELIEGCSERALYEHATVVENRDRFARLALLFGWLQAGDHQFIYTNAEPHLVHSVDHGHFFPGGPDWTPDTLNGAAAPVPDPAITTAAALEESDFQGLRSVFAQVSDAEIAAAVAAVPSAWALPADHRAALCQYLSLRRDLVFKV